MNASTQDFFDTQPEASLCPLCAQPNHCAMELAKASGEPQAACWCTAVEFSAELLATIPAAARGRACVCQACASQRKPA